MSLEIKNASSVVSTNSQPSISHRIRKLFSSDLPQLGWSDHTAAKHTCTRKKDSATVCRIALILFVVLALKYSVMSNKKMKSDDAWWDGPSYCDRGNAIITIY